MIEGDPVYMVDGERVTKREFAVFIAISNVSRQVEEVRKKLLQIDRRLIKPKKLRGN